VKITAVWESDRFLGCWGAIAKRSVGIAVWDVGVRSLLGMWGAIAFGVWGCDRCL